MSSTYIKYTCFLTAVLRCPGKYRTTLKTRSRSGEGRSFYFTNSLEIVFEQAMPIWCKSKTWKQLASSDFNIYFIELCWNPEERKPPIYLQCHSIYCLPLSLKSIIMAGEMNRRRNNKKMFSCHQLQMDVNWTTSQEKLCLIFIGKFPCERFLFCFTTSKMNEVIFSSLISIDELAITDI